MPTGPETIAAKVPLLPESPGVYLWKDAAGAVLYVGKAKKLRSRVRQYVTGDHLESVKTRALMHAAADVETIVVPSEAHALVLENSLIKEHRPRFNIALRDDKSYPYIKVTLHEDFPRVLVTRRLVADGGRYFGPYTDVGAMRRALQVVQRIFTVRSCHYDLPRERPDRACLDWHIGRCQAPCIGAQSREAYRAMVDEVVLFLEGRTADVVARVRARMAQAAEALDFERAAALRDSLRHLERMAEPTVVLQVDGGDRDVVGFARDGDDACVAILRIRDGALLARDHRLLEHVEGEPDDAILTTFLARQVVPDPGRARELLVPFALEDLDALEAAMPGTRLQVPQRGTRRELVDLAQENARHLLEEFKLAAEEADARATNPVYELQRELGLATVPRALVCFDISHAQGRDTVASAVWFENGRPRRGEYRTFSVRTVEGIDDFASMREVVSRFFARRLEQGKPLPDLCVIDGGKGQLGAAKDALDALGLHALAVASLAKREEEVFLPGRSESLRLSRRSPALRLLQQARDEAHRFALTYQRRKRTARTLTSELLEIPGVGPAKRRALLAAFGSLDGVRAAAPEQIAALPGFGLRTADKVLAALAASRRSIAPAAPPDPPTP